MLRLQDELGLTPEQVRALREVRADFQRGAITRTAEIELAAVDLRGLMEQDTLDLPKVEAQVRKIALLRAAQHVAGITMVHAGKTVLTPEQQETFKHLTQAAWRGHPGMGMMAPGMPPARPMP
jgi:Spy/CpxP family protein refolding chaperone